MENFIWALLDNTSKHLQYVTKAGIFAMIYILLYRKSKVVFVERRGSSLHMKKSPKDLI